MKVKKYVAALFLGSLLIISVTGCGGGGGSTVAAGNASSSVSDGGTKVGSGVATLSWNPPQNQPGVAGFKVYYGTAPGTYTNSIHVGMASTFTVNGLAPGTYYFAVTAVDSAGNESGYSNEASKTIS